MVPGRILAIPGCDHRIFGNDWALGRESFIQVHSGLRNPAVDPSFLLQPWSMKETVGILSQALLFGLPSNTTQDGLDKPGKKEKKAA